MSNISSSLTDIFSRIPRRHHVDNVKEIYSLLNEYEDVLMEIEKDPAFEKQIAAYFDAIEPIKMLVKKSTDNKASKKQKDDYFDEASSAFKDTVEELINAHQ